MFVDIQPLFSAPAGGCEYICPAMLVYYDIETYENEWPSNCEIMLNDDGQIRWNFDDTDFDGDWYDPEYDYDLFTGLYIGPDHEFLIGAYHEIPKETSYLYGNPASVPVPSALLLLGSGFPALLIIKRRIGKLV